MYDLADRVDPKMAATLTPWDPKILLSWVIFLAYTAGLVGHRFWGWRGRRMNIMAVAAFIAVALALVVALAPIWIPVLCVIGLVKLFRTKEPNVVTA